MFLLLTSDVIAMKISVQTSTFSLNLLNPLVMSMKIPFDCTKLSIL